MREDTLEERTKMDIYMSNVTFIKNYLISEHDRMFMNQSDRESAFNDGVILWCEGLLTYRRAPPVVEDAVNEYMIHVKRNDMKPHSIKRHSVPIKSVEDVINYVIKKKKKVLLNSFHNPKSASEMFDDGVFTLMGAIRQSGIDNYDKSIRERYAHRSKELYRGITDTLQRKKNSGNGRMSSSPINR